LVRLVTTGTARYDPILNGSRRVHGPPPYAQRGRCATVDGDSDLFHGRGVSTQRHGNAANLQVGFVRYTPLPCRTQLAEKQLPLLLAWHGVDRVTARRELHRSEREWLVGDDHGCLVGAGTPWLPRRHHLRLSARLDDPLDDRQPEPGSPPVGLPHRPGG
jgi:hypothetical protein